MIDVAYCTNAVIFIIYMCYDNETAVTVHSIIMAMSVMTHDGAMAIMSALINALGLLIRTSGIIVASDGGTG